MPPGNPQRAEAHNRKKWVSTIRFDSLHGAYNPPFWFIEPLLGGLSPGKSHARLGYDKYALDKILIYLILVIYCLNFPALEGEVHTFHTQKGNQCHNHTGSLLTLKFMPVKQGVQCSGDYVLGFLPF
jgi:hypothetical protein